MSSLQYHAYIFLEHIFSILERNCFDPDLFVLLQDEHKMCDTFCLPMKLLFKDYISLDLYILLEQLNKFY